MSRESLVNCLLGAVSVLTLSAGLFFFVSKFQRPSPPLPSPPPSDSSKSDSSDSESDSDVPLSEFELACLHFRECSESIPLAIKIKMYGLYKQATAGDAPSDVYQSQLTARGAMGASWASEAGRSREDAEQAYIKLLRSVSPMWRARKPVPASRPPGGYANVVSRPQVEAENPETSDTTAGGKLAKLITKGERSAVLEVLQRDPAMANARDAQGLTPLHWAADQGKLEICVDLLRFGAEISAQDHNGDTPLHMAAVAEQISVLELLISRGARSDLKNKDGELPEDTCGNPKIRQLVKTLFLQNRFPNN